MTYNVFGGTLSLTHQISQSVGVPVLPGLVTKRAHVPQQLMTTSPWHWLASRT